MRLLTAILLAIPQVALAHGSTGRALAWTVEPWVGALLVAAGALYAVGLARLWRHAGSGSGIQKREAGAFVIGWLLVAVALCSPLDELATGLFSAHMIQHEVLMVAAAPLLVLSRPLATWAWALPLPARRGTGRWTRRAAIRRPWQIITHPFGAFMIHAAALWIWHIPGLFAAALANPGVHALQHASFFLSALLFWWAVWGPSHARLRDGPAILYLFATMLHTGALGALLTLLPAPRYGTDPVLASAWGLSALEDQQVGGLIMWIPAGTVYVAAALYVMARWLAASGPATPESAS